MLIDAHNHPNWHGFNAEKILRNMELVPNALCFPIQTPRMRSPFYPSDLDLVKLSHKD